jgi:ankyrin repeat protein
MRYGVLQVIGLTLLCAGTPVPGPDAVVEAAKDGRVQDLDRLLAENGQLVCAADVLGETALQAAASRGHVAAVRLLLNRGAQVGQPGWHADTPLHRAVSWANDPGTVAALLRYHAQLEAVDEDGLTPLQRAARHCHDTLCGRYNFGWLDTLRSISIIQMLLDAGAHYDILSAIFLNDVDRVRSLVAAERGLVGEPGPSRTVPLRLAANLGRINLCKVLLGAGADPEGLVCGHGRPILCDAVAHPDVVRLLLWAGARADRPANEERGLSNHPRRLGNRATPLHYAAAEGDEESARLLLVAGADVGAVDSKGLTPLHLAALYRGKEMTLLLLQAGADPEARSEFMDTPRGLAQHQNRFGNAKEAFKAYKGRS